MSVRPRLTPEIADIRRAVREAWESIPDTTESDLFMVALSGGADSLALAAATGFEAPRAGFRAGAIIVDHGLQEGSADVAERASAQARQLGLDPVRVIRVQVGEHGGPEAAARIARYGAFAEIMVEFGAKRIMLAHTLNDQAETVLLGLARGSGATSLQGMAPDADPILRPLLGIRRDQTEKFCTDSGLEYWSDPHNDDDRYTRVRIRKQVLPVLEAELGPGVAESLARTAEQLREDAECFEQQVEELIHDLVEPADGGVAISISALQANPAALRNRIVRYVALHEFGVSLHRSHTLEVMKLVTDWRGQQGIDLPGIVATRSGNRLILQWRITSLSD